MTVGREKREATNAALYFSKVCQVLCLKMCDVALGCDYR